MIGLDSGFFFRCATGRERAQQLFARIQGGETKAAVSSVTLFEILRHGYRGALPRTLAETVVDLAEEAFVLAGVDDQDVLRRAAAIAYGDGLAMADAMIAASLERVGCTHLHTTDHDFDNYEGPMHIEYL